MADGSNAPAAIAGEPPAPAVADQDTAMADARAASTPTISTPTHARVSTPVGGRTSTPQKTGGATTVATNTQTAAPSKAILNGARSRQYLNEKVTTVLLEGVKKLASEQPETPLKVLGEYLIARSKELEST